MSTDKSVVLVVGASGTIGQPTVAEAYARGYETRALVRDSVQANLFSQRCEGRRRRLDPNPDCAKPLMALPASSSPMVSAETTPSGRTGGLRRRAQCAECSQRACPDRTDDYCRCHEAERRARLETPWRTARARQRAWLTPSFGLAGSTTTPLTNSAWYCGKGIRTGLERHRMEPSLASRLLWF